MDLSLEVPDLSEFVTRYGTRAGPIVQEEIKRGGDAAGEAFRKAAIRNLKNPSSDLAQSVQFATTISGYSGSTRIWTDSPVGKWLDEGTGLYGPHAQRITPTSKKALAFTVNGQQVVVRSTAGIKPQRWWQRAKQQARSTVMREFRSVPKRIVDRLTRGGG